MTAINWDELKESPTIGDEHNDCKGCAFRDSLISCEQAFHDAKEKFGGDCMDRNVIYIQVETTK